MSPKMSPKSKYMLVNVIFFTLMFLAHFVQIRVLPENPPDFALAFFYGLRVLFVIAFVHNLVYGKIEMEQQTKSKTEVA